MTNVIDSHTSPVHLPSSDDTFLRLVGGLEGVVDARQRRALAWARFMGRLRSIGYAITIGPPA